MGLNYFSRALKCPLNLKFYDSDETIALCQKIKHTPGWEASSPWRRLWLFWKCCRTPRDSFQPTDLPIACSPDWGGDIQRCAQSAWVGRVTPDNITVAKALLWTWNKMLAFVDHPVSPALMWILDQGWRHLASCCLWSTGSAQPLFLALHAAWKLMPRNLCHFKIFHPFFF